MHIEPLDLAGEIIQEKYGALQHEAIHFLNEVVYGEQKNIKINNIISDNLLPKYPYRIGSQETIPKLSFREGHIFT